MGNNSALFLTPFPGVQVLQFRHNKLLTKNSYSIIYLLRQLSHSPPLDYKTGFDATYKFLFITHTPFSPSSSGDQKSRYKKKILVLQFITNTHFKNSEILYFIFIWQLPQEIAFGRIKIICIPLFFCIPNQTIF